MGILCGVALSFFISFLTHIIPAVPEINNTILAVMCGVLGVGFGIIFFLITPSVARKTQTMTKTLEISTRKMPLSTFACGLAGLFIGFIFAFLISQMWSGLTIPIIQIILSIIVYILLGYIGWYIGAHKAADIANGMHSIAQNRSSGKAGKGKAGDVSPKILDTSVIIDGRIADIMKTGFLEGQIVIPEFVLTELRHIADSSDELKRNRGRRGLDILNKIQKQHGIEIFDTDSKKNLRDIKEVDECLLELASMLKGKVVTNDYNLNKVAVIKNVPVLNINELANTLKPIVLPGETMELTPIREGKEERQALAYLDDGTMIVVEDGRQYIGMEIRVTVTSVLQTSAGRMIFARKG